MTASVDIANTPVDRFTQICVVQVAANAWPDTGSRTSTAAFPSKLRSIISSPIGRAGTSTHACARHRILAVLRRDRGMDRLDVPPVIRGMGPRSRALHPTGETTDACP